jgi:hypothetical protein
LQTAHDYAYDMPVWVTEAGYDLNSGSPLHAIPIGNKTAEQTQADWILRTALLYNRMGIERVFFYEMYDDNAPSQSQFASSGLINDNHTRRAAADYLYQANKLMGQYVYQETISKSPLVDHYTFNGLDAYVLMMPTENGSTLTYNLKLVNANTADIYTPKPKQDSMSVTVASVVAGQLSVPVSETPVFVIPVTKSIPSSENDMPQSSLLLFPNPASSKINFSLNNNSNNAVTIAIYDFTGKMVKKKIPFEKPGRELNSSLDIQDLKPGMYLFEVQQDDKKTTKIILKK